MVFKHFMVSAICASSLDFSIVVTDEPW